MGREMGAGMAEDGPGPHRFRGEDIDRISRTLAAFLKDAGARAALLIDRDGPTIVREGEPPSLSADVVSRLVAESFESARRLAGASEGTGFSALYRRKDGDSLQLSLVDERSVLAVISDGISPSGMIYLWSERVVSKLAEFFGEIRGRGPER